MKQRRAKDMLEELDVRPAKTRGQNFVIDSSVIDAIVGFGAPEAGEKLIEVGPGLGALTERLAAFPNLAVIEIESKFCKELERRFPHVSVICADFRSVQLHTLGSDLTVFGNLPYAFSTDIIFHLVESAPYVKRAVLLLQREFAERLAADPGGRDYGVLSVSCQLWADVALGPIISGDSFHPPTKVASRCVALRFRKSPRVPLPDPAWFLRVVRAAFFRRRKKLSNSLTASGIFSAELVLRALNAAQIDAGRRAETLSIEEFAKLASALRQ